MLPALLLLLATDINLRHAAKPADPPISVAELEAALRPGSRAVWVYDDHGLKAVSSLEVVCAAACTGTGGVPVAVCVKLPTLAWECVDVRGWLGRN